MSFWKSPLGPRSTATRGLAIVVSVTFTDELAPVKAVAVKVIGYVTPPTRPGALAGTLRFFLVVLKPLNVFDWSRKDHWN